MPTGNSRLRVLYDGWPLAFEPVSPSALHLLEILDSLPAGIDAWLALPREIQNPLQANIHPLIETPVARFGGRRMVWEQATLPGLIRKSQADLLHTTTTHAPLVSPVPCLVSPAEGLTGPTSTGRLADRLRDAFGRGGMRNALLLWPEDLPRPDFPGPWMSLPMQVHRAFCTEQDSQPGLPDSYVLVPSPLPDSAIPLLVAAWRWAATGLNEAVALMTCGLSPRGLQDLHERCQAAGIANPVEVADAQGVEARAALFQQSTAVLLVGPVLPWGDAFSQALASGCPLAAEETGWSDARVGPAGYLVPPGDPRALGAALLTLLVEEPVAESLRQAAHQRAAAWRRDAFTAGLAEVYEKAASAV